MTTINNILFLDYTRPSRCSIPLDDDHNNCTTAGYLLLLRTVTGKHIVVKGAAHRRDYSGGGRLSLLCNMRTQHQCITGR